MAKRQESKKRSRTRERKQAREKQQRRNRQLVIIGAVVIVAIGLIALSLVSNTPAEAPIPEGVETRYEGIERSRTVEGYPRLGDPDAPVRVEEFSSFSCPGCASFHETSFPALIDRVRTGEISFTYIPLQTGSIPNAKFSGKAALCAGEQDKFWEMHDVLFDWHTRFVNTAFSQNRLFAGAAALGLNESSFNSCMSGNPMEEVLSTAQGEGINSTPTIRVNGSTVGLDLSEINDAITAAIPAGWTPSSDNESLDTATEEPEATEEAATDDTEATEEPDDTGEEEAEATPEEEATEEAGE